MGVRFACHACGKRLNIKSELAGRRGICPQCSTRFRIPVSDTAFSTPIQASDAMSSLSLLGNAAGAIQVARQNIATSTTTLSATSQRVAARPVSAAPMGRSTSLFGDATTTWYVRPPGGGQYGPANGPTMIQWVAEGRVAESSMVWRDGWDEWAVAKVALAGAPNLPWETGLKPANNGVTSTPSTPMASAVDGATDEATEVNVQSLAVKSGTKRRRRKGYQSWVTIGLGALLVGVVVALGAALGWIG